MNRLPDHIEAWIPLIIPFTLYIATIIVSTILEHLILKPQRFEYSCESIAQKKLVLRLITLIALGSMMLTLEIDYYLLNPR